MGDVTLDSGAKRSDASNKGRFDLLPYDALLELAVVFEWGAELKGARNWEKGIPMERFLSSAMRHLARAISGETKEPHLGRALWNIACAIQTEVWLRSSQLPANLRYPKPVALCRDFPCDPDNVLTGPASELTPNAP